MLYAYKLDQQACIPITIFEKKNWKKNLQSLKPVALLLNVIYGFL